MRPEIIAHRGASHDAPENTLAAFRLGWAQGADAAECDVHLTADGQVVVIHDPTTTRTTERRLRVASQPIERLRQLDAGAWKSRRWRGERLPTLAELLAVVPRGKRLFIEIKSGAETVAPLAANLERSPLHAAQVAIIGFDLRVMALAKRVVPRAAVYAGFECRAGHDGGREWAQSAGEMVRMAKASKFDGFDVDATGPIDAAFVAQLGAAGLKLFVWTVNDAAQARRLASAGVTGITTDRPGWLRSALGGARRRS